jgi:hypothetical protein
MKINYKFFLKGAVMLILTAPFLFGQDLPKLSLKSSIPINEIALLSSLARKEDRIASRTLFDCKEDLADTIKGDSTKKQSSTTKKFRMKKSPTVAVLLSAVLPGAGQFYNQSYWKIPILGTCRLRMIFRNNNIKITVTLCINSDPKPRRRPELQILRVYRGQRWFVWYFLYLHDKHDRCVC